MSPCPAPPGRLNILMVSDFFHPNTGGVETHIYQLSQCLLARGHGVVVLTHSYGPLQGERHLTNGLKVVYLPRLPIYQAATFPTLFGAFRPLRRLLLAESIHLVHAHQAFSTMAHEAVLHARTMGLPVVFTDHSLFGFADAASILVNKVLKFTLADVAAAICVSHTSKENTVLRACIPPQRVFVVPNAVEGSLFRPLAPRDAPPGGDGGGRGDSSPAVTVVVMGRMVYRKGVDLLAAVLPELCRRHAGLRVLIGGDGPKRPLLEAVVAAEGLGERVRFVGAVPHDRVRDLLVQGQIFLNCSLTEAFCVSLVEAAAAGLLVVSTRVGGVPEVLPVPNMLLLAEPSPEGVAGAVGAAVVRLAAAPPDPAAQQAQHDAVVGMYSWHAVAVRTEEVYREALGLGRDDSPAARLARYARCGKWFGKLCCCVVAVDWLVWRWLEWWDPADAIPRAHAFPALPEADRCKSD